MWYAEVEMLSVNKSCAMGRASVGLGINNAATNKTWKQRHDRGISGTVLFFLRMRTRETDLGNSVVNLFALHLP